MTGLLDHRVRPTPGAWAAEPLSAQEIDALPNADRVWATIMAVRAEYSQARWRRDMPSGQEPGT